mmetsp:Transcript_8395/g.52492  ORF Transcript_8395/g.52492 Transcript_8395/m.52492 type:complete len:81 (+) Transcript_8395:1127-1369(+)
MPKAVSPVSVEANLSVLDADDMPNENEAEAAVDAAFAAAEPLSTLSGIDLPEATPVDAISTPLCFNEGLVPANGRVWKED